MKKWFERFCFVARWDCRKRVVKEIYSDNFFDIWDGCREIVEHGFAFFLYVLFIITVILKLFLRPFYVPFVWAWLAYKRPEKLDKLQKDFAP